MRRVPGGAGAHPTNRRQGGQPMRVRKQVVLMSESEAAQMLGLEPAAVALFVKLRLLRTARQSPPAFREADVAKLRHLLDVRTGRTHRRDTADAQGIGLEPMLSV